MYNRVYMIGIGGGAETTLSDALRGAGTEPVMTAGPADIPVSHDSPAFAVVPYYGPDTFSRTLDALFRRGITSTAALIASPDFRTCAEAFRAGADDVIATPIDGAEIARMVSWMREGGAGQRREPQQVRSLEDVERDAIVSALEACRGQVSLTARRLGIGRSTLYRKIELYDLASYR